MVEKKFENTTGISFCGPSSDLDLSESQGGLCRTIPLRRAGLLVLMMGPINIQLHRLAFLSLKYFSV